MMFLSSRNLIVKLQEVENRGRIAIFLQIIVIIVLIGIPGDFPLQFRRDHAFRDFQPPVTGISMEGEAERSFLLLLQSTTSGWTGSPVEISSRRPIGHPRGIHASFPSIQRNLRFVRRAKEKLSHCAAFLLGLNQDFSVLPVEKIFQLVHIREGG